MVRVNMEGCVEGTVGLGREIFMPHRWFGMDFEGIVGRCIGDCPTKMYAMK